MFALLNQLYGVDESPGYHNTRPESMCPPKQDGSGDTNKFQVMFNVTHFLPEEIKVKIRDNFVVIHGQHEQKQDQHGYVSREFTRRYPLPEDVVPSTVSASLTKEGILIIRAPRKQLSKPKNEIVVPIVFQQPYFGGRRWRENYY